MIPVLLGVLFLVFTINHFTPGDPVVNLLGSNYTQEQYDRKEAELGLDKPFLVQYCTYVWGIATRFDLGTSYTSKRAVSDEIIERLPNTLKIGIWGVLSSIFIAIPLGVKAARKQYSFTDYFTTVVSMVCISMPTFFLATLLKYVFSIKLGWFDLTGMQGRDYLYLSEFGKFLDMAKHFVLPAVTLTVISIGSLMRYTRTNMLEVLSADYIRTARAKGVPEKQVINRHAFRNTLIPLVTTLGGSLPGLFSGALITETLFGIRGIGYASYTSMTQADIPFVMFYLAFISILTLLGNLISDLLYAAVDPRVRLS